MHPIRNLFRWLRSKHWVWIVLPYAVASALSTIPTDWGVVALLVEWVMFGVAFAGWRLRKDDK